MKKISTPIGAYLDAAHLADLGMMAAKINGQKDTARAMRNLRQELWRRAQAMAMEQDRTSRQRVRGAKPIQKRSLVDHEVIGNGAIGF